jgi:hypothetical protein
MDNDPFAGKLGQWMLRCTSYWQSILRIGIPFIFVVRGINYVQFQMASRKSGAKYPYPFPSELIVDVCIVLFVSAVFCWLIRKLSALEQSNQLPLPWKGCWLHRSRAICVLAMAFWIFPLTEAVLEITGILHPKVDWLAVPLYGVGIWFFATLVTDCKRRLERLFYCIGIVQMSIVAAHAAIPMSAVVTRFCEFADATLSAIEIVLSGTILLWHFRKRMDGSDSREPT